MARNNGRGNNIDRVNSLTLQRWERKMESLRETQAEQEDNMKQTLGRIFKNPEIKRALQAEKNASVRQAESGAISPMQKALIDSARRGGELGYVPLESDSIDFNEVANKPWEKD